LKNGAAAAGGTEASSVASTMQARPRSPSDSIRHPDHANNAESNFEHESQMSEMESRFNVNQTHTRSFANISSIKNENSFEDDGTISTQRPGRYNDSKPNKPPNPTNLPQNLDNIKQAYYSKMQALTQKLEDEKNRQRERSHQRHNSQNQNLRERSRSRSMTI